MVADEWLEQIPICRSPYREPRPQNTDIRLIVIHGISLPPGQFGGPYIEQLFCGQLDPNAHPYFAQVHQLRVSSHLLIRRDGSVIQFVPLQDKAWHAGVSCYHGQAGCNDFSIGIELEGTDLLAYEPNQYQRLAQLCRELQGRYPIDAIVGHSDVAAGRKTDPGPSFDWSKFNSCLETEHDATLEARHDGAQASSTLEATT
jgi:AmpD protein